MKTKILLLEVGYLICTLGVRAQVTVSGNLQNSGIRAVGYPNTVVRFSLKNYGVALTHVTSTGTMEPDYLEIHPNSNGVLNGTVQGNDTISPINTYYEVCISNNGLKFRCQNYMLTGTSFNLDTATPINLDPTTLQSIARAYGLNLADNFYAANMPCDNFNGVLCIDPENSPGWGGAANCTTDINVCITAAIASLPTFTINSVAYPVGIIDLRGMANSKPTQATTLTVTSPYVSFIGPGASHLQITCTMNADCWNVRDDTGGGRTGSQISGFTLVGPGSRANAVGIHTGDLNRSVFHDLAIDNFTGTNSACIWIDNTLTNGQFERNRFDLVELGIHEGPNGIVQSGCTKEFRFTVEAPGTQSFGYNEFRGIRMSIGPSQFGFSLDGGFLYNSIIEGSANVSPGGTLFAITRPGDAGEGDYIEFPAECDGACSFGGSTRWSLTSAGNFLYYSGPGLMTGGGSTTSYFADSMAKGSFVTRTADYSTHDGSNPFAAGKTALWLKPDLAASGNQINELIGVDSSARNWEAGFGGVEGPNIAHPIVWGYGGDPTCFEVYVKGYETPLTSSNRIANFPCGLGNSTSSFVLDNSAQTLTNKTLTTPALTGSFCPSGSSSCAHANVSVCTTSNVQLSTCSVSATWSNTLANTTYRTACQTTGTNVAAGVANTSSKTTTTMSITLINFASGTALSTGTVDCVAFVD